MIDKCGKCGENTLEDKCKQQFLNIIKEKFSFGKDGTIYCNECKNEIVACICMNNRPRVHMGLYYWIKTKYRIWNYKRKYGINIENVLVEYGRKVILTEDERILNATDRYRNRFK
jgi:hypothetical protein